MIGFINMNDIYPIYAGFYLQIQSCKRKKELVYFILFVVVFQLVKEMQGHENKTRADWERGCDMSSWVFHFCVSLYIASYQCSVLILDIFSLRSKRGVLPYNQGFLTAAIFQGIELSAVRKKWWE